MEASPPAPAPVGGVDRADTHRLLAYAVCYGCTQLELVYPQPSARLGASDALPMGEIADGARQCQRSGFGRAKLTGVVSSW